MRNSTSNLNTSGSALLAYRPNDSTPLFGAVLLLALRKQLAVAALIKAPFSQITDRILAYFSCDAYKKCVSRLPCERFRTTGPLSADYQETLLIPCDNDSTPLNESYFQYRGYIIDPGNWTFTVLRGDPMEIPTQDLCERFSDLQKIYAAMLTPPGHSVYFPYRIEKKYSFDELPDVADFLRDAYSAVRVFKKVSARAPDREFDPRPEMSRCAGNSGRNYRVTP